jgi:hypothetical protein
MPLFGNAPNSVHCRKVTFAVGETLHLYKTQQVKRTTTPLCYPFISSNSL